MNSAFHFKLGFMIEIDGWKSAANGVDSVAVADVKPAKTRAARR